LFDLHRLGLALQLVAERGLLVLPVAFLHGGNGGGLAQFLLEGQVIGPEIDNLLAAPKCVDALSGFDIEAGEPVEDGNIFRVGLAGDFEGFDGDEVGPGLDRSLGQQVEGRQRSEAYGQRIFGFGHRLERLAGGEQGLAGSDRAGGLESGQQLGESPHPGGLFLFDGAEPFPGFHQRGFALDNTLEQQDGIITVIPLFGSHRRLERLAQIGGYVLQRLLFEGHWYFLQNISRSKSESFI